MEKNLGWSASEYAKLVGFESDWRDLWWHQDYLELLARRWDLNDGTVLDVGCGAGHWGQRVATLLPDPVITGVDHEEGFLDAARERAKGRAGSFRYQVGTAEALPFDDDTFDMVTCQTVLIHVREAEVALREMIRVTRPGGLVVAAEPNNTTNALTNEVGLPRPDFDETLRLLYFGEACLRGKKAMGQGDSAAGERLPSLFLGAGLERFQVSTNDRCAWLVAPYETEAEQGNLKMLRESIARGTWRWGDRERTRVLFEAGGGDLAQFDELWATALARQERLLADIDAGRHTWGGGFVMYIASGRKPA